MPFHRRLRTITLLACIASAAAPVAPRAAFAQEPNAANVAAARRHYEKARADYAQGAYREAITELEAGYALDPNKYLVFNLGVVHEKLGDIDDALKWFRQYTTMSLTPQERERAESYLRRLEGAKKELEAKQAAQQQQQQQQQQPQGAPESTTTPAPPPPPPEKVVHGRIDALTITAASVTTAALALGIVMGVKALHDNPGGTPVTGHNNLTYTEFVNQHNTALREGLVADIGFGTAVVAAAATAVLYFGRTRPASTSTTTGSTTVSAAPLTGGGAVFVQGSF
jgi:hypothetical protein